MFAFSIYDKDCSGNLSPSEVEKMIKDVYGKKADTSLDVKHCCAELKQMGKHEVLDDVRFNIFGQTHHNLMYPAWHMQDMLSTGIVNQSFWGKQRAIRQARSNKHYVPLNDFLGVKNEELSSNKRFQVGGLKVEEAPHQRKKSMTQDAQVHPGGRGRAVDALLLSSGAVEDVPTHGNKRRSSKDDDVCPTSDYPSSQEARRRNSVEQSNKGSVHEAHFPKHRDNDDSQPEHDHLYHNSHNKSADENDHRRKSNKASVKSIYTKEEEAQNMAASKLQAHARGAIARKDSEHVKKKKHKASVKIE
jgi:hypothetical protein